MKRLKGHLKYYLMCAKSDLLFMFTLVTIFTIIKLVRTYMAKDMITRNDLDLVRFFATVSFFYLFGVGITNTFESFPFILSLSSSRREFYLGVISKYVLLSGIYAGVLTILFYLEKLIFGLVKIEHSGVFDLYGRQLSNGLVLFLVMFVIYMGFLSLYSFFGALLNRFKTKTLIVGLALAVIIYILYPFIPGLQDLGINVIQRLIKLYAESSNFVFCSELTLVSIVLLAMGWLVFRKAEIKVFEAKK